MLTAPIELLAPAGDFACLEAALDAGADAVYLGLTSLNARRRARNFSAVDLSRACELAHARGRRIYLTLNIDLAQAELADAARSLELARRCRVDAVLVRDPAVLALARHFPELQLHFSTQSCIACSADVEAARTLGVARVVLARELTLGEIESASAVSGVESEVFTQGALCFSVSGRCLLASWVGGRSGNRGQCTSPCRVPWTVDGRPVGTPLSMHDLSLVERIDDLRRAGVRALKIEGRLKTAAWVRAAVSLFRKAIDGTDTDDALVREAEALGAYTGRKLTSGYLDADRGNLTGVSGRPATAPSSHAQAEPAAGYSLCVHVAKRIECVWSWGEAEETFEFSRAEVRRPEKALSVSKLLEQLSAEPVDGVEASALDSNDPTALLVPRTANAIEQRVQAAVRRALRARKQLDAPLRPEVVELLAQTDVVVSSRGARSRPDRARIAGADARAFLETVRPSSGVVLESCDAQGLRELVSAHPKAGLIAALPTVLFEADLEAARALLLACRAMGTFAEVNSWGGWHLAKHVGVRLLGGPGMGVLNSLAVKELGRLGFEEVTASMEADSGQLEALLARSPVPCSVVVFGRPALMSTRVDLPAEVTGGVLEDRREVKLRARREGGLWQLRPTSPFDLRGPDLPAGAAHLVVDLVGSPDPAAEWSRGPENATCFNFARTLS